jgi:formate hydrogenlyase subunit 6/NADH:ubiquinone oxidoreductase subunit I
MKIGAMLGDVFRSLFRRPVTRQYPFERKAAPQRLRGKLHWDPEKCTGCLLCVKDCPAQAIEVFMVDKANKRFVMRYHLDRCTYCAQCVISCRPGALVMSNDEWELAATTKEPFTVYYGDEADVERLMAELAEANADGAQEK